MSSLKIFTSLALVFLMCAVTYSQETTIDIDIGTGGGVVNQPDSCCFYWIEIGDPKKTCYKNGAAACSSMHPKIEGAPALCNNLAVGQAFEELANTCLDEDESDCRENAVLQPIVLQLGVLSCPGVPNAEGACACDFVAGDATHVESVRHCGGDPCSIETILGWFLGGP